MVRQARDHATHLQVQHHIGLCQQGGWLEVRKIGGKSPRYLILRLTLKGHEKLAGEQPAQDPES